MSVERATARKAGAADAALVCDAVTARDARVAAALACACDGHFVQFYEDDGFLVDAICDWFAEGLGRGEACVAFATAAHLVAIGEALVRRGLDPVALHESGQLQTVDAHDALERFTVDQVPDAARFEAFVGGLLHGLRDRFPAVRAFGEMVALLAHQGLVEHADRLEGYWDQLATRHGFALFCAYPMDLFASEANGRFFRDIRDRHRAVIPAESFLAQRDEAQRHRFVAELQQKALALAGETERRKQEQLRVRQRDARLRLLGALTEDAVWLTRGGRIVEINEHGLDLLGARHDWQVIGRSPFDFIHPDDHEVVAQRVATMLAGFGDVPPNEQRMLRVDGGEVDVIVTAASFDDDGEVAFQVVARDIRERRKAREADAQVERLARTDDTTGLLNRTSYQAALVDALAAAAAAGEELAVLHVDLDRFKLVNDTLGHEAGDAILRQASLRLQRALRDGHGLARFGSDEFVLFARGADGAREGRRVAASIIAAFHDPFEAGERLIFSTPSIGVAVFPRDGMQPGELMRCADLALHEAKKAGGNTTGFFTPVLAASSIARLELENRLHRALEQDEFRLCYQPVYDVDSGGIVAVEALLRWFPADGPPMMPSDFIPVAEETGLIQPIGDWVLRTACAQVRAWQQRFPAFAGLRLAVNVSPRQLRDMDPRGSVQRFLDESGLSASHLTLELTESTFLKDLEPTLRNLDQLRAMGVRLSIDDFGTGYSCLAYLRRLPIDEIKIDRSFVSELVRSPSDSALVSAILAMAQALGLQVIAEGIEGWEQLQVLRDKGCRAVQGYGLGRPMFAEDATRFLVARAERPAAGFTAGAFQLA